MDDYWGRIGPIRFRYPWGFLNGADADLCLCGNVRKQHEDGWPEGCTGFELDPVDEKYQGPREAWRPDYSI
jgi:hypothetical protein